MRFSKLKPEDRVAGGAVQTSGVPQKPTSSISRIASRNYILLTLACTLAGSADAQFAQQGGKLVGTESGVNAQQGWSVALSADGNTAIVGGPTRDDGNGGGGAVWVYTRWGGVWTQQGSELVGTSAVGSYAQQGTSVALSADGNTAIVGGPADSGTAGAAWVYTRSGGVWTQQGSKLVGTGALGTTVLQGWSVALSSDGNTAIVGGPNDNGGAGAAWMYTRLGDVWTQQGSKLVGTGAAGSAQQGYSVALSSDGNTAIVGGPYDSGTAGAAWVYTRSGGVWTQQGSKLVGTGAAGSAQQGTSVALSSDGNTAIVGGPNDNGGAGAAWVYTRLGDVWTQQGSKMVGTGAAGSAQQGTSVALSSDGNTAIVGGPDDDSVSFNAHVGAAWVFVSSAYSSAPSIASGGVVNGASFLPGIAPGTWITIEGTNLSATTRSWNSSDFSGNNLPTQLDGVRVSVGGQPAYVSYISPTQINALVPNVGTGTVLVTVTNSTGTSPAVAVVCQPVQPAFFQWGSYVVATRQDYSLAVKNGTISGLLTVPAKPGDVIILWGTGFGPTNPSTPVGVNVPSSTTYYTANEVMVTLGKTPATVYATALSPGFAGLYQVAIQIPTSLANGDYPVVATVFGAQSPSATLITVQQ